MKKLFLFIWVLFAAIVLVGCTTEGGEPIQVLGMEITSEENVHTITVGETLQLDAKVYPTYISQLVEWSTSNEYVASVDETGLVTAVGGGKVEITATYKELSTISQKYLLIVEGDAFEVAPESIKVTAKNDITSCKVGEVIRLSANVYPEAASQKVTWVSSDETVATVNRGMVRPLKEGEVEISVYPNRYENIVDTIKLTFEKADDPIYSTNWNEMEFASHDLFMECDDETPLKIKGVVTHINPSSNDKVSYFVQNGSEGFYIYSQDTTQMPVELGKSYEIGGFKKTYRGLSELTNVEYFVELEEEIKYQVNNVEGLDVSSQEVMGAYQCSFVTGKAVLGNVTVGTKAYNFTATVNGVEATFRVDPTYADDEQFAAINSLLQIVAEGTEFTYTGVVIAYSSSEVTPQILILNEKDLNFGEISDEDLLKAASGKLDIVTSIGFAVNTIDLPTTIEGFDCEVIWDTDSELIDPATGVVKHGKVDERVTVIATIVLNGKSVQKEFFVTVEALDEKVYETLVSLDLEDALAPNSWGNSETKPSYAAAVVELGTPKAKWLLQNALIACTNSDKYNGNLGIRAQVRDSAAETARIEIMESGEYNLVEFAACIYGNDVLGTKIRIEYTFDDGATWEVSENIITVNNTVLETFRVKLPEGAKRVAIVLVEGSGRRVNFDDIKLMK